MTDTNHEPWTLDALTEAAERISADYAATHGIVRDGDWYGLKLAEEVGELIQAHMRLNGRCPGKGLDPSELKARLAGEVADVLCHTLLLARDAGVDVAARDKWLVWGERR